MGRSFHLNHAKVTLFYFLNEFAGQKVGLTVPVSFSLTFQSSSFLRLMRSRRFSRPMRSVE